METIILKQNQRRAFHIEHNGIRYRLGVMIAGDAMKKAHLFVRKYVLREWHRTLMNMETTAVVLCDGERFASVRGYHRNRRVVILHEK